MLPDNLKHWIRQQLSRVGFIVLVFAVIVLGELLPPLRALHNYLETHLAAKNTLTGLAIAMTVVGTLLLALTQFFVRVGDEQSGVLIGKSAQSWRGPMGWVARRFAGLRITAGFHDEAPIWEIKKSFQQGIWWSKPRWRRFTLMGAGAFLLLYGLFGLFIVVSPPGVKLLAAVALVYATVRTAWAFYRAEPPP